jgi:hypothetical protein
MKTQVMKTIVSASLLLVVTSTPMFAQDSGDAQNYVVVDTVGNCSVINAEPSPGLKVIGKNGGYDKEDAAEEFLTTKAKDMSQCKGLIAPI